MNTELLLRLALRKHAERQFWVLSRPQKWFENLLVSRNLDLLWKANFRINRETFMKIVEIVRPYMTSIDNNFRRGALVETKVAAAL